MSFSVVLLSVFSVSLWFVFFEFSHALSPAPRLGPEHPRSHRTAEEARRRGGHANAAGPLRVGGRRRRLLQLRLGRVLRRRRRVARRGRANHGSAAGGGQIAVPLRAG